VSAAPHARTVTVVVCSYSDDRFAVLERAVASVVAQACAPHEVVVVVDHNDALLARARATLERTATPRVRVVPNAEGRGLSGARNTGVRTATGDIVAFLDDDASAHADWMEATLRGYDDPGVIGTGGAALPSWSSRAPAWFPEEFLWVVGCTYRGLPTRPAPVRNPIGANMSFRREVFDAVGGFRHGIGRVGRTPLGGEETELAIRARQSHRGTILFLPDARVDHVVPEERATWRYFRSRCFAEGVSKAIVARSVGSDDALESERAYVTRTLPAGVLRGVRDAVRGDRAGLARAGAIVLGLAVTTLGYGRGRLARATGTGSV